MCIHQRCETLTLGEAWAKRKGINNISCCMSNAALSLKSSIHADAIEN